MDVFLAEVVPLVLAIHLMNVKCISEPIAGIIGTELNPESKLG